MERPKKSRSKHFLEEVENISEDQLDYRLTSSSWSSREIAHHLLEMPEVMTGKLCRPDIDFHRKSWGRMERQPGWNHQQHWIWVIEVEYEQSGAETQVLPPPI